MSNNTVKIVTLISVIAIILSVFNVILILNNNAPQNIQVNDLQNSIDQNQENLNGISSELSDLRNQVDSIDQTTNIDLGEIRSSIGNIENLIGEITNSSQVDELLRLTTAQVYARAYKSVVLIRTAIGQGSGFLLNNSNTIITNYHVTTDETDIEIEFYDRTRTSATIIGSDPYSDISVLHIDTSPSGAEPLVLSNKSTGIGQQVIAIGNPLGLTDSLSVGYISQVNRTLDIEPIIIPVFQLDLTIAPGSSGGPLLDLYGDVVGITNAGTDVGFNFAVPVTIMKRVIPSLINQGYYNHPFLGVSVVALTPEIITSLNILNVNRYQNGLLIMDVVPNSPAEEAGLTSATSTTQGYTANDIILAINNIPTFIGEDLTAYLELEISPGETITLNLWRSSQNVTINITTTERPPYQG
ncbi:MAG: trypsin-like peptidase domain-containing protein [Candidatus Bathyarchaeota archaeon]